MTITLDLPASDEARLNDIAAREGQSVDTLAYKMFAAGLADFRPEHPTVADVQPPPEVELTQEEEIEAIRLGLEDSFAGRVTPLAEWSARFRARHNIPEGARAMTHEEALRLP